MKTAFRLGRFLVEPDLRRIEGDGRNARVSPKAMDVLLALMAEPGWVVARSDLLDRVWPDVVVGDEVLSQAIAELRRAFGERASVPDVIGTVPKTGYRLLVEPVPVTPDAGPPLRSALDLDAYCHYLEACRLVRRQGKANVLLAAELLEEATARSPALGMALPKYAETMTFIDLYYDAGGDRMAATLDACARGRRDPATAPDALAAEGFALASRGRFDTARERFSEALRLKPHSLDVHFLLGRAALAQGHHLVAATMLERVAELRSDDFHALLLAAKARRNLGDEHRARADLARADARLAPHLRENPDDPRAVADRVFCLLEAGARGEALDLLARAPVPGDPTLYYAAGGLARAGEVGTALDLLEAIVDSGWSHCDLLVNDPDFVPLSREPRFRRLLDRLAN